MVMVGNRSVGLDMPFMLQCGVAMGAVLGLSGRSWEVLDCS